jgi:hypothetical protein
MGHRSVCLFRVPWQDLCDATAAEWGDWSHVAAVSISHENVLEFAGGEDSNVSAKIASSSALRGANVRDVSTPQ